MIFPNDEYPPVRQLQFVHSLQHIVQIRFLILQNLSGELLQNQRDIIQYHGILRTDFSRLRISKRQKFREKKRKNQNFTKIRGVSGGLPLRISFWLLCICRRDNTPVPDTAKPRYCGVCKIFSYNFRTEIWKSDIILPAWTESVNSLPLHPPLGFPACEKWQDNLRYHLNGANKLLLFDVDVRYIEPDVAEVGRRLAYLSENIPGLVYTAFMSQHTSCKFT